MKYKSYNQMTPREHLVDEARFIRRRFQCSGDEALNAAIDGWRNAPETAPIRAMAAYFLGCGDRAHVRLIREVERS